MGFQESEASPKKWVVAGIPFRGPQLKPIFTKASGDGEDDDQSCSTTPTGEESRIPTVLTCPPAPRKKKPSKCVYNNYGVGAVREFFCPPDLETVFMRHVETAK